MTALEMDAALSVLRAALLNHVLCSVIERSNVSTEDIMLNSVFGRVQMRNFVL